MRDRIAVAEAGRRRVAREIHDDFSQRLAGLAFSLKAVSKALPEGSPQRAEIAVIGGSLADLGEDLRRLSHDLHPAALEGRGLAAALGDHCGEIERRHGLRVQLSLDGAEDSFPPDVALGLYRIVQEALANIVRHAGAHTARVALRAASGMVRLTVADDGGGFDPGAARRAGGVGLASIEERALLLRGGCRIAAAPGAGTEIEATVPLPAEGVLAQLRELVRRHRRLVASTALVTLALAGGLVATTLQARRAEREAVRIDAAERLLQRALAIRERALAPDDPDLAGSLEALGLLRQSQGRLAEAVQLLERQAAIVEKIYGPEHPELARTLLNLGLVQKDLGDKTAARRHLERARAIFERKVEPKHPLLVHTLSALAGLEPEAAQVEPRAAARTPR